MRASELRAVLGLLELPIGAFAHILFDRHQHVLDPVVVLPTPHDVESRDYSRGLIHARQVDLRGKPDLRWDFRVVRPRVNT